MCYFHVYHDLYAPIDLALFLRTLLGTQCPSEIGLDQCALCKLDIMTLGKRLNTQSSCNTIMTVLCLYEVSLHTCSMTEGSSWWLAFDND